MTAAEPILEVQSVVVRFGRFTALSGVNLCVNPGEIRVLLGPNGAGKSTLLDAICGKARATEGHIVFKGKDITAMEEAEIARQGIARKFQAPTVFKSLTVLENIEVARRQRYDVISNIFRRVNGRRMRLAAMDLLEQLGLWHKANRLAAELSHGESQWLELGMTISQDPELLLLDEPTAGMTVAETEHTARLIQALRGQRSIVVVEHDMAFVKEIAETITVLHLGKVLAEGSPSEVEGNSEVKAVYLGDAGVSCA